MSPLLFQILGIVFLLSFVPAAIFFARAYRRQRGARVIVCPETITPEAVQVDAVHAAWTDLFADPEFRLVSCSRWPEREGCPQLCLAQIEEAPDGCLVRERLAQWYRHSTCAICRRSIGEVRWYDQKPGLMAPDRKVLEWNEIAPEDLPEVLGSYRQVCFDCAVAERFRERFPERVIDDPRPAPPRGGGSIA